MRDEAPMWIFCSGLKRSGSTLQYQIAKTLVEEAGVGQGLGFCLPREWASAVRAHREPGRIYVVKCHRYLPGAAWMLRSGRARSLFIYRDLRDACVSWMYKTGRSFEAIMAEPFLQELLEDDMQWAGLPNTLTSRYERVVPDLETEVRRIAEFLGLPVDDGEARRIAEAHSLERQKRRIDEFDFERQGVKEGSVSIYDPDTLLHHNHVHSGAPLQWSAELTPEQVARIEQVVGGWLVEHGYELASDARARPAVPLRRRVALRLAAIRSDFWLRAWLGATGLRDGSPEPGGSALDLVTRPFRVGAWRVLRGLASVRLASAIGGAMYRLGGRRSRGELSAARRILVVRLDRIGDVLLTAPLLRELRRSAPGAELTLVVRPELREFMAACPYVDRVLTMDPEAHGSLRNLVRHGRALRLAAAHLWLRRPDIAILPRLDADLYHGTFLLYFSGAARRVAYSENVNVSKAGRNAGYDRLLTDRLEGRGVKHEAERNLDVLRALGGEPSDSALEPWCTDRDRAFAAMLWDARGLAKASTVVALGIGAGDPRRRWPVERFIELGQWLGRAYGARVVVLGGRGEEPLGRAVADALGELAVDLVGQTSLGQAGAVLERTSLFVGNDTGIMHLAAAAGVPVVELSCHPRTGQPGHGHSPLRFGPWRVEHRILQPAAPLPPCRSACSAKAAHCILAVETAEAVAAVSELLGPRRRSQEPAGALPLQSHAQ